MRLSPDKEILRRGALFRALADRDLDALAACMRVRAVETGTLLFAEGDPGASMLLVAEGQLVASVRSAGGSEHEINRMGAGEIVGEMAFLDPAPRSASVRAATRVVYYELDRDGVEALWAHAPAALAAVTWAVVREVTRRLRRLDDLIERRLAKRAERA